MEDTNNNTVGKLSKIKFGTCWLIITLLYVLVRINIINIPLERDEGLFGYIGQLILNHGLPYRDAFEQKPPVVYYIYALALLLVRPTSSGIHIFLHLYNFLSLLALYFLSKIYFRSSSAGLWAALSYAILSSELAIQGFMASSEMFLLLPISLSLLFAVLAIRKSNLAFFILSGITGALACWTKQIAVFIVLFILLYMISSYLSSPNKTFIGITKILLAWCAGALGVSLIIMAYFYHKGVFSEFIYWSFEHGMYYSRKADSKYIVEYYFYQIKNILIGNFILIGVSLLFGFIGIFKRDKSGFFVLGFIAFSLMGTIPGYAYAHYFAVIAPSLAVGAGYGFSNFADMIKGGNRKLAASILCAMLVILPPIIVNSGYYFLESPNQISRDFYGYNPFPESAELAEYIARNTNPDDRVFIFGTEPQILFYSQRKSATSHVAIYPLMANFQRHEEFQRKAWQEIISNSPKYVLFVNIPTSVMWDRKASPWLLEQTLKMLESDYYLEAVMVIVGEKGQLIALSSVQDEAETDKYWRQAAIFVYRKRNSSIPVH